jgi:hypothetical protein
MAGSMLNRRETTAPSFNSQEQEDREADGAADRPPGTMRVDISGIDDLHGSPLMPNFSAHPAQFENPMKRGGVEENPRA